MAKRRGNHEGSWSKRKDGLWSYRVSMCNTSNGLCMRKSFYGVTKGECMTKYKAYMSKLDERLISSNMKLVDWLNEWLVVYKKGTVSDSTYYDAERMIKKHISCSSLANMRLGDVKPIQISIFLAKHENYSYSHTSKLKKLLSAAYNQAVDNDLCAKNPCANIRLKNNSEKPHSEKCFTLEEMHSILESVNKDSSTTALAIKVLTYTGMRRGELLGLMWSDIDFDKDVININRVVYRINKSNQKAIKPKGKTTKSTSGIALLPLLKEILLKEKKISIFVIPNKNNEYYHPSAFSKRFKSYLVNLNCCRPLGTHGFRHALGTHLRRAGVSLDDIKEVLRHTDTKTTQIYAESDICIVKKAMNKLPY